MDHLHNKGVWGKAFWFTGVEKEQKAVTVTDTPEDR